MAKNHEEYVYAGGIRNRINRVTLRTSGESTAHCNNGFTGQNNDSGDIEPRTVIERTMRPEELPVERKNIHQGNPPVKDNQV